MTTITAEVIEDSYGPVNPRITTLQLRYPRFIHAELMTHRVFSRNASSSRAVPVPRLIEDIRRGCAMPIHWGKNKKGMQADEQCNEPINLAHRAYSPSYISREKAWHEAKENAIDMAERFHAAGYHKQIVNRLLEPFSHINVLVTSTDWANWYALRDHPDAQPEICALAKAMREAMDNSQPTLRCKWDWHLPYISKGERNAYHINVLKEMSGARCARVSYLTFEMKKPTLDEDLDLYSKLMGGAPVHASPTEHQAMPDVLDLNRDYAQPKLHGNFRGWIQNRKTIPGECVYD